MNLTLKRIVMVWLVVLTVVGIMEATVAAASPCFDACREWCQEEEHGDCWYVYGVPMCIGACDDETAFGGHGGPV